MCKMLTRDMVEPILQEIKKLDLTVAQSQALIQAARAGYYPEVSVQGTVGLRHQDIAGTKGEWLVGAFLDFPFFEGGVTKVEGPL